MPAFGMEPLSAAARAELSASCDQFLALQALDPALNPALDTVLDPALTTFNALLKITEQPANGLYRALPLTNPKFAAAWASPACRHLLEVVGFRANDRRATLPWGPEPDARVAEAVRALR